MKTNFLVLFLIFPMVLAAQCSDSLIVEYFCMGARGDMVLAAQCSDSLLRINEYGAFSKNDSCYIYCPGRYCLVRPTGEIDKYSYLYKLSIPKTAITRERFDDMCLIKLAHNQFIQVKSLMNTDVIKPDTVYSMSLEDLDSLEDLYDVDVTMNDLDVGKIFMEEVQDSDRVNAYQYQNGYEILYINIEKAQLPTLIKKTKIVRMDKEFDDLLLNELHKRLKHKKFKNGDII